MDSTFLGVLAGFGLKAMPPAGDCAEHAIELRNANERLTELLENLGVLHLFKTTHRGRVGRRAIETSVPVALHSVARRTHARLAGSASDSHGPQSGKRRALQGCDQISGGGFAKAPGKSRPSTSRPSRRNEAVCAPCNRLLLMLSPGCCYPRTPMRLTICCSRK